MIKRFQVDIDDAMSLRQQIGNDVPSGLAGTAGEQNAFLGGHGSTPLFLSCVHHGHSDAGSQCLFCLSGRKTLFFRNVPV